ncbi:zeta toxin family protein [Luteibacter aegosomaticola]|uniref:zeta toxin family protein n=1 Tax=Luteibacter aegosomaticola TaxID=2911538 RepID=UPI001FF83B1C|nr:zeta toxin family protein [Luteibacter aegosomaticola]UPG89707.1 zeta toxin family protein [Luteibacter aegosomaticola]
MSSHIRDEGHQLDPITHERIFAERIVPRSGIPEATSHVQPKAIILAGQPGAGKGGLASQATTDLRRDVVKVDPDELRDYHPGATRFRAEHPYTWPTQTHPDASQWASELRDAAISQKKNLIIDTTLGNGDAAVGMIRNLQANGYEVEIRAVATHRLQSEAGVDSRFTQGLDRNGFGRYVPAEVREHVYRGLPSSLDKVQAQTDAPIRIFNRQGQELYDSRTDARRAGDALTEAREQPLTSLRHTREVRDQYRQQLSWHDDLAKNLPEHTKVPADARAPLLQERESLHVVKSLTENAVHAERGYNTAARGLAMKGLGAAGVATMAYDAAHTSLQARDLLQQENVTGAQSGVLHFGTRTLGMATGAVVVGGIGAAAGIETGPGAFVTGTVGAIAGGIGGDKIADAVDNYRIYHQRDPQGLPWRYDPEKPEQGWVSDLPPLPNVKPPIAEAALQNRLDYQASGRATELRMAQPGELPDPYKQPASAQDPARVQAEPWSRDPRTHAWTREVVTDVVDRAVIRQTETASPSRATELDKAAEQTIAQNRMHSPQGVAAAYQAMYQERGWDKLGPMPDTVSKTLKEAERTVRASDGHAYTQAADGQWSTPGMLYGRNAAEGNVRDELNATQRQTHAAPAPESAKPVPAAPLPPARLDDPNHPDHAFYLQTREKVHQLDRSMGRTPDQHSDQVASALTVQARADGLNRIDQVALGKGGETLWAVQTPPGRTDHLFDQRTSVPTATANTPMEQSAAQWPQAMQQFQQSQQESQAKAQTQQQAAHTPAMSH